MNVILNWHSESKVLKLKLTEELKASCETYKDASPYGFAGGLQYIIALPKKTVTKARKIETQMSGRSIKFYIPGMVRWNGISGKYQAVSITGNQCQLQCDHCAGRLLVSMTRTETADDLINQCIILKEKGNFGVLISGGCDRYGRLPWDKFISAIETVKVKTGLYISVHSGLVDRRTAYGLKAAGVDQVLIDVIGDDDTYRRICHVDFGVSRITDSMDVLVEAGLDIVPHVVCGLYYGQMKSESAALKSLARFPIRRIVIVSMMRVPGAPSMNFLLPKAEDVARIIAEARTVMPDAAIGLGCARERGNRKMEILAIDAGVNRMALPSDEAIEHCRGLGLDMEFHPTCCSVSRDF